MLVLPVLRGGDGARGDPGRGNYRPPPAGATPTPGCCGGRSMPPICASRSPSWVPCPGRLIPSASQAGLENPDRCGYLRVCAFSGGELKRMSIVVPCSKMPELPFHSRFLFCPKEIPQSYHSLLEKIQRKPTFINGQLAGNHPGGWGVFTGWCSAGRRRAAKMGQKR